MPHKSRWINSRQSANREGRHAQYSICYCKYGKDHDDTRSISAQNSDDDMLTVAIRETWHFAPEGLKYLKHWLNTSGDFIDHKLQPRKYAKEIIEAISN